MVLLVALAVLAIAVAVPRLTGATTYTILTGSMRPGLPPGTLVVMRSTPPGALRVGDVVTYQLESGSPTVATHRIVAMGVNGKGERTFRTQGDANDTPDPEWVRPVQIRGKLWYAVPYVGWADHWLNGQQRALTRMVVAAGLGGYALVMFGGALRDRRRSRQEPAVEQPMGRHRDRVEAAR